MCGRVTAQSSPELKAAVAAASLVGRKVRVSSASQRIGTVLGTAHVGTIGSIKDERPEDERYEGAGPVFYVDMEKSPSGVDMPARLAGTEFAAVFLFRDEFELLDEQGITEGSQVRVTKLDNDEFWIDELVKVGSVGVVLRVDLYDNTADVRFDGRADQYVPLEWLEMVKPEQRLGRAVIDGDTAGLAVPKSLFGKVGEVRAYTSEGNAEVYMAGDGVPWYVAPQDLSFI